MMDSDPEDGYRDILGNDSWPDDASSDEVEEEEIEAILYSQLHFEPNPDVILGNTGLQCQIMEEQQEGDPDANWRERLLGVQQTENLLTSGLQPTKVPIRDKTVGKISQTKVTKKKKSKKSTDLSMFQDKSNTSVIKESPLRDKKRSMKKSSKKDKNKRTVSKSTGLSVIILSSDTEAEEHKRKLKGIFVVTNSISDGENSENVALSVDNGEKGRSTADTDSDYIVIDSISDVDENKSGTIKDQNESDFIVIDSISDIESPGLANASKHSSESDSVVSLSCSDSSSSYLGSSDSETVKEDVILNVSKDRQSIVLDCAKLEDYAELSIDDVHKSMKECDWSLITEDRHSSKNPTKSRYFLPLNVCCHNCKERGHLSKVCPQPKKAVTCFLCGLEGHLSPRCPNAMCFNCFTFNHGKKQCPEPKRLQYYRLMCSRCSLRGHSQAHCPELWRQYHITIKPGPLKKLTYRQRKEVNPRAFCYVCGRPGHFGYECRLSSMHGMKFRPPPFVSKYKLPTKTECQIATPSGTSTKRHHSDGHDFVDQSPPYGKPPKRCNTKKKPKKALKPLTQSQRFEAEYTGRSPREVQSSAEKRRNPRNVTKLEEKHSGDFPRSNKAERNKQKRTVHRREDKLEVSFRTSGFSSRKRKSDDVMDLRSKLTRYNNMESSTKTKAWTYDDQDKIKSKKRKVRREETRFTSGRGFRGSKRS